MGQRHKGRGASTRFRWLSRGRIPADFDLRRCGWSLEEDAEPSGVGIALVMAGDVAAHDFEDEARRLVMVVGVDCPVERSTVLAAGFGEAVGSGIDIVELGARAGRVAQSSHWLPRQRRLGDVLLDLLAREAYGHGKPLNLNPREFALIWRLADSPNLAVSKQELIQDVWRMGFVPETNSIAVHMSRLRRKLAFVGLDGMIETATSGGYRLVTAEDPARDLSGRAVPLHPAQGSCGFTLKH